jgi:fatty-acyl-CoA synthase
MAHPGVLEAAVIAVSHPKWQERPLACVVVKADQRLTKDDILSFLGDKIMKWWLPDDVVFLEAIPKTSVGKFDKKMLRQRFRDHRLPTA